MMLMRLFHFENGRSKYCCDKAYTSMFSCLPRVKKGEKSFCVIFNIPLNTET